MIDDVARALCEAAGKSQNGIGPVCLQCGVNADGSRSCGMAEAFTEEAKEAIRAVYRWHKRERRWPAWVTK